MSDNIQFEGRTYRPTGFERWGGEEYTNGQDKFLARKSDTGVEVFVGMKNFQAQYRPLTELTEAEICWWVDESDYDLTGYKLLD